MALKEQRLAIGHPDNKERKSLSRHYRERKDRLKSQGFLAKLGPLSRIN